MSCTERRERVMILCTEVRRHVERSAVVEARIAGTTRRTSRDPALFRPLDGTVSRMSIRRKAQEMRHP